MESIKKFSLAIGLIMAANCSFSQVSEPVMRLQDFSRRSVPAGYTQRLGYFTLAPGGNLHYLYPFYYAFKEEKKFRERYSDKGYYDELSQYFAFAGDYLSAQQYLEMSYDTVDDAARARVFKLVEGLNNIQHADARRYIHFRARTSRVIMINEAYAKPQHRAFTLSLLEDLYHQGFRYLAMEMLNNHADHSLTKLNLHTGYYCSEPVAGELVRTALALGYTLISYEDTAAARHSAGQRDSIRALNIYKIIQQDSGARILVHASYADISKKMSPDGFIPMGLAFKDLSGIDPLTIDQTDMTEEGNFGYGRVLYQAYLFKYPLTEPSVAMIGNEPVNVTNNDLYDLAVIHPPAIYQDGRPTWLTLNGMRQPFFIKPTDSRTFLVQAYYQEEIEKNEGKPWQLVPADQSYIPAARKSYLLYLKKGKYSIYFRDLDYHILGTLGIEVD
jgi:hypothetical protein